MQHYERLAAVSQVFEEFASEAAAHAPPDGTDDESHFTSKSAYLHWIGDSRGSLAARNKLHTVLHDRQAEMQLQDNVAVSLRW